MPAVALTPRQEELKKTIEEVLEELMHWEECTKDEVEGFLDRLATAAFDLHCQLKEEGQEPAISAVVIAKRGMKPDAQEFYRNMHAAESLLDFISGTGYP